MAVAAAGARGYGPAALALHLPPLWAALRGELLPPADSAPPAAPEDAGELVAAAADCLSVHLPVIWQRLLPGAFHPPTLARGAASSQYVAAALSKCLCRDWKVGVGKCVRAAHRRHAHFI